MNEVQWVVRKADFLCWSRCEDLVAQKHGMVELIRLKVSLHWMKERVLLYSCSCFSDARPASLLRVTVADGSQPLLEDRISWVKFPCSTSMMHFLYAHLFSCAHGFCSKLQ